jgi:hypothetical protein
MRRDTTGGSISTRTVGCAVHAGTPAVVRGGGWLGTVTATPRHAWQPILHGHIACSRRRCSPPAVLQLAAHTRRAASTKRTRGRTSRRRVCRAPASICHGMQHDMCTSEWNGVCAAWQACRGAHKLRRKPRCNTNPPARGLVAPSSRPEDAHLHHHRVLSAGSMVAPRGCSARPCKLEPPPQARRLAYPGSRANKH